MTETLANGYSSDSTQRELFNEYQHGRVKIWFFKKLCVTVIWMKVASASKGLTLPMLRLLSSKSQGHRDFWKPCKLCRGAIHWIALTEYFQMSTHSPGFPSFFRFLRHFIMAKLATSTIRVKHNRADTGKVTLTH